MYGANIHGQQYNFHKYTLLCVRVSDGNYNSSETNIKNSQSGPCVVCCQRLWKMGFGKIAFTNSDNEIEIYKLKDYKEIQTHLTSSYRVQINKRNITTLKDLKHNLKQIRI